MRIPAFFSQHYAPVQEPLLARLDTTRALLQRLGLITVLPAQPVALDTLEGLHARSYLHGFLDGEEPMASRQRIRWSADVRDAALYMLGGQLQATRHVLSHGGTAMNIARGFHHAHPASGSAFCPLNGLALIAHAMPTLRVMVIDCDEHGADGTEAFTDILPNLFNVSIFGTRFGCRGSERSWAFHVSRQDGFSVYLQALQEAARLAAEIQPDVLVYQAGADCHRRDPKSLLQLSTRELFQRDLFVFRLARKLALPTVFVVAGGYQSALRVARLNANTVRAARFAWQEAVTVQ